MADTAVGASSASTSNVPEVELKEPTHFPTTVTSHSNMRCPFYETESTQTLYKR